MRQAGRRPGTIVRTGVLALVLALLAHGAGAQEGPASPPAPAPSATPAKPDPADAELESIRKLVKAEAWKPAKAAIEKFLTSRAADPRMLGWLPPLEEDLQKCLFRLTVARKSPEDLLGRGCLRYETSTGRAEFHVGSVDADSGWVVMGNVALFDVLFDGEMAVEMRAASAPYLVVLLGADSESRGGHMFTPVRTEWGGLDVDVTRVDPAGEQSADLGTAKGIYPDISSQLVRYFVEGGRAGVATSSRERGAPRTWSSSTTWLATRYRRGFVTIASASTPTRVDCRVSGRLDPIFAKRQFAEAESNLLREWRQDSWDRTKALPRAVLDLESRARAWTTGVPAGCPEAARGTLAELMAAAFERGPDPRKLPGAAGLAAPASHWQTALIACAEGRMADAETAARVVAAADQAFAPAHAVIGRALLARGADAAASASFAESLRLDAGFAPAYDGLAVLALRAGDVDAIDRHLAAAAAHGTSSMLTTGLRSAALRLRRGPQWRKSFETNTTNFRVTSDAGVAVCAEVGKVLEEAVAAYERHFRRRDRRVRGRVRVFSGPESYAEYVGDLGHAAEGTAGMYLPSLRELCVFLDEDRAELWSTIRHEAFHQYVHQFVEELPDWFNEGYAEYFGYSRHEPGRLNVGEVRPEQAGRAVNFAHRFTTIERLSRMDHTEFMAGAEVNYVQSWVLIHTLRNTAEPSLTGLLDRYFEAMLAGRSREEAYAEVLAPQVEAIESEVRRSLEIWKYVR